MKITIEYRLLNGKMVEIEREFKHLPPKGTFVIQPEEGIDGMFRLEKITEGGKRFIVKQIDCDPIHWKGDGNDRIHGPDEDCNCKCQFYEKCPISTGAMLCADTCS